MSRGTNTWADFSICLWLKFRYYQDVSVIIMYNSVLPLPSCSPPPVCPPWICRDSCLLPALPGGKMLPQEGTCTTPSAVSCPTLRKQSIALKWCNCFPDSFSFVFHSPQKGASFSSRHESYTRHVDSNPFLVALRCCILPLLLARLRDRSLGSVRTILS